MATFRQCFGKTYLTSSRKIYFVGCHRRLYAAYHIIFGVDFVLGKHRKIRVKAAGQNVKVSHRWTIIVTILAFVLSVFISALTLGAEELGLFTAILVLFLIVLLGIVFDIAGMAVSTASEEPFHAMAAKKISGAKEGVAIIRSAQQISSVCNDVIGDIAGIISGAMTTAIVVSISVGKTTDTTLLNLVFAGIVAALMIGGKAAGKGIAMKNNNTIVFIMGKIVYFSKRLVCFKRKNKKSKR